MMHGAHHVFMPAPDPVIAAAPSPGSAKGRAPTLGEEIAHAVTHGVGALLAIAGLVVLVITAVAKGTTTHVIACAVFGATLLLLYLASTIYHAVPARMVRAKRVLQRCDHAAIYLLIAGTYTPFTLVALAEPWGAWMFGLTWGLASIGLAITVWSLRRGETPASLRRYERWSLALYLAMGWSVLIAIKPLIDALPGTALSFVIAGGVAYTLGVAFFVLERKWAHSVWHGFVMAGSGFHFFAVFATLAR